MRNTQLALSMKQSNSYVSFIGLVGMINMTCRVCLISGQDVYLMGDKLFF